MRADIFLSRLDKVRSTGSGTWIACCPAHQDKHPSMTVREADDRVLVHCFADCSVEQILASVGLTFDALFPEKPRDRVAPLRRPFPASDVLEALALETLIVAATASQVAAGCELTQADKERLWMAHDRIVRGRNLANG